MAPQSRQSAPQNPPQHAQHRKITGKKLPTYVHDIRRTKKFAGFPKVFVHFRPKSAQIHKREPYVGIGKNHCFLMVFVHFCPKSVQIRKTSPDPQTWSRSSKTVVSFWVLYISAPNRPRSKNTITHTPRGPQQTGANGGSFLGDSLLNELLLAADESTCLSPGARGQWPVSTTGLSSDSPGLCASGHCTGTCAERRGFHSASLGFLVSLRFILFPRVFLIRCTSWLTKPRVVTIARAPGKPTSRPIHAQVFS